MEPLACRFGHPLMLAAGVAIFVAVDWDSMPVLQRATGLFFIGLVMHLWEEGRFPGGFVEMVTENLRFAAISRTFGEVGSTRFGGRFRAVLHSECAISGHGRHDPWPA
jgi:hypothetical protein